MIVKIISEDKIKKLIKIDSSKIEKDFYKREQKLYDKIVELELKLIDLNVVLKNKGGGK